MGFVKFQNLDAAAQAQLLATHLPLGRHPKTGDVFLTREVDRYSGTYILGVAGGGKSAEMQNSIIADIIRDNTVILIDPLGDTADKVLASMPAHRLAQTYVLNMLDEQHPFIVNLLATTKQWPAMSHAERTALVERTVRVVNALFGPEVLKQISLPRYLVNATILLLSNPGTTFYDLLRVFRDSTYRQHLYARLDDSDVRDFWRYEFDELTEAKRKTVTDPLMGRLQQIFVGHPITRAILSQPHTTIDFRQAIEQRQNLLIKLPRQILRQDAEVIGLVIVALIHEALFSFADLPEQQRPGFSLFIDEFECFVTKDIEEFFTQGRKYGVRLTVAHQLRTQLSRDLQKATAAARTKICFQLEADDAKEMAQYFPAPDDGRLEEVSSNVTMRCAKTPAPITLCDCSPMSTCARCKASAAAVASRLSSRELA